MMNGSVSAGCPDSASSVRLNIAGDVLVLVLSPEVLF